MPKPDRQVASPVCATVMLEQTGGAHASHLEEAALDDVLELLGRPWRGRRHDDGDDAVDAHDPAKQLPKEHRSE
jgi:hypothetical protein